MTDRAVIRRGDCIEVLRGMADGSVDAVVTVDFDGVPWHHRVHAETGAS